MLNVKTIKFLDRYIGNVLCFILSPSKLFYPKKLNITNILIIQLWGIGESVLTLPALRALRKKFQKANIEILVTERNKEVYFENKGINKIISIKLGPLPILKFILKNRSKYDLIIDMEEYLNISSIISFFIGKRRVGFSHNMRSKLYTDTTKYNDKQHCSQTFVDLLKPLNINFKVNMSEIGYRKLPALAGKKIPISEHAQKPLVFDKLIKLNYSVNDKKFIDNLFKNKITKKDFIVGIAPGAAESAKSRMWPKENFIELSNQLIKKKKNIKIIFIGNDKEKNLIKNIINKIKEKDKIINLAGKISLRQLFYLTEKCNLVISNDAGAMHIAAAQGVKTIGLFGPNLPVRFGPLNKKSVSIYKGEICKFSPCINVHKGEIPDCYYKGKDYQKCMKDVKVGDVLRVIGK